MRLTVLYDAGCPLCSRFRDWLAVQPVLVSLDLVAACSTEARQRFPGLDHARTLAEITVVADDGTRGWSRSGRRPPTGRSASPCPGRPACRSPGQPP